MHPKFQYFSFSILIKTKPVYPTAELTQGKKNPIIKIALIGPDKTPNKDKVA